MKSSSMNPSFPIVTLEDSNATSTSISNESSISSEITVNNGPVTGKESCNTRINRPSLSVNYTVSLDSIKKSSLSKPQVKIFGIKNKNETYQFHKPQAPNDNSVSLKFGANKVKQEDNLIIGTSATSNAANLLSTTGEQCSFSSVLPSNKVLTSNGELPSLSARPVKSPSIAVKVLKNSAAPKSNSQSNGKIIMPSKDACQYQTRKRLKTDNYLPADADNIIIPESLPRLSSKKGFPSKEIPCHELTNSSLIIPAVDTTIGHIPITSYSVSPSSPTVSRSFKKDGSSILLLFPAGHNSTLPASTTTSERVPSMPVKSVIPTTPTSTSVLVSDTIADSSSSTPVTLAGCTTAHKEIQSKFLQKEKKLPKSGQSTKLSMVMNKKSGAKLANSPCPGARNERAAEGGEFADGSLSMKCEGSDTPSNQSWLSARSGKSSCSASSPHPPTKQSWNTGMWTKEEIQQLQHNVSQYCDTHSVQNPSKVIFGMSKVERSGFYKDIALGINRPLFSVYRKVIRMYDCCNYLGRYSTEELDQLRSLWSRLGNNWQAIGAELGRSSASVKDRCRLLVGSACKKGAWSAEEEDSLAQAVSRQVSNTAGSSASSWRGISWSSVSEAVGSRSDKQCRAKWLHYLDWKRTSGVHWGKADDLQLICRLSVCGVTEEASVDWAALARGWPAVRSPHWLRSKWWTLKQKLHANQHSSLSLRENCRLLYNKTPASILKNTLIEVPTATASSSGGSSSCSSGGSSSSSSCSSGGSSSSSSISSGGGQHTAVSAQLSSEDPQCEGAEELESVLDSAAACDTSSRGGVNIRLCIPAANFSDLINIDTTDKEMHEKLGRLIQSAVVITETEAAAAASATDRSSSATADKAKRTRSININKKSINSRMSSMGSTSSTTITTTRSNSSKSTPLSVADVINLTTTATTTTTTSTAASTSTLCTSNNDLHETRQRPHDSLNSLPASRSNGRNSGGRRQLSSNQYHNNNYKSSEISSIDQHNHHDLGYVELDHDVAVVGLNVVNSDPLNLETESCLDADDSSTSSSSISNVASSTTSRAGQRMLTDGHYSSSEVGEPGHEIAAGTSTAAISCENMNAGEMCIDGEAIIDGDQVFSIDGIVCVIGDEVCVIGDEMCAMGDETRCLGDEVCSSMRVEDSIQGGSPSHTAASSEARTGKRGSSVCEGLLQGSPHGRGSGMLGLVAGDDDAEAGEQQQRLADHGDQHSYERGLCLNLPALGGAAADTGQDPVLAVSGELLEHERKGIR